MPQGKRRDGNLPGSIRLVSALSAGLAAAGAERGSQVLQMVEDHAFATESLGGSR